MASGASSACSTDNGSLNSQAFRDEGEDAAEAEGPRPVKRRRIGSGDSSRSSDTLQESSGVYFPADLLVEYKWPSDDSGEYYMLQEQICEYLGVTSFKRKYPDLERHDLSHKEKLYLRELNVITETQCTLGLTALRSDEVVDLMIKEYPVKYSEYSNVLQDQERQRITDRYREYSQQSSQKVEPGKVPEYIKKAARKAAEYNSHLNHERSEERRAYFDLQTYTIQVPLIRPKILPPEETKVGAYPVALIPGQFQEYYKRYTPNELRYLPINAALYEPPLDPNMPAPDSDGAESDDGDEDPSVKEEKKENDSSSVSDSSSSSEEGESPHEIQGDILQSRTPTASQSAPGKDRAGPPAPKESTPRRTAPSKSVPGYKAKVVPNAMCGICLRGKELNRHGRPEALVHCSQCDNSGHPSCLDMSADLVAVIKTYPWQCMECKACVSCGQPHHEEHLMFCDTCDRGFHTFCVGLDYIPTGRWNCRTCEVDLATPKKSGKTGKRGKSSREG
uniref:PHD finger protein 10 isoform X2 n=1 Tax=Myxine glutinosa TaxID=7769 RepID=UPI00358FEC6A